MEEVWNPRCVPTALQKMIHPFGPPATEGVTTTVVKTPRQEANPREVIRLGIGRKQPPGGKTEPVLVWKKLGTLGVHDFRGRGGGSQKLLRRDKFVDTMEAMKLSPSTPGKLLFGGKSRGNRWGAVTPNLSGFLDRSLGGKKPGRFTTFAFSPLVFSFSKIPDEKKRTVMCHVLNMLTQQKNMWNKKIIGATSPR